MIRLRFHGRGGHGVKTASRIVGTAAFLAGYQVQDSPIYGAERRGAAVAAFTRISEMSIRERGVITQPDVIIVGDETLLDDAAAGVLSGQESASAVFVNAASADSFGEKYSISAPVVVSDVTGLTLESLGRASALSAGLGAAAARLIGIVDEEQLSDAVREELAYVDVAVDLIEKNVQIASDVFHSLAPVALKETEFSADKQMHSMAYDEPLRSAPSILTTGNAAARHTGSWRVERPEIDYDRCTRCGICFVRCPDGAIALDERGYPVIDYDHCKGCMICWDQCPVRGAIEKKKEVRAW